MKVLSENMGKFCFTLSLVLFFLDFFDSIYFKLYEIAMPCIIFLFWEFVFAFKEGMDEVNKRKGE
jgi:hypothetical protein